MSPAKPVFERGIQKPFEIPYIEKPENEFFQESKSKMQMLTAAEFPPKKSKVI